MIHFFHPVYFIKTFLSFNLLLLISCSNLEIVDEKVKNNKLSEKQVSPLKKNQKLEFLKQENEVLKLRLNELLSTLDEKESDPTDHSGEQYPVPLKSEKKLYELIYTSAKDHKLKKSLVVGQLFLDQFSQSLYVERVLQIMANSAFLLSEYKRAFSYIDLHQKRFPFSPYASSLIYLKSKIYKKLNLLNPYSTVLHQIMNEFPNSKEAQWAYLELNFRE